MTYSVKNFRDEINQLKNTLTHELHTVASLEYEKLPGLDTYFQNLRDRVSEIGQRALNLKAPEAVEKDQAKLALANLNLTRLKTVVEVICKSTEPNSEQLAHLGIDFRETISNLQPMNVQILYQMMRHVLV